MALPKPAVAPVRLERRQKVNRRRQIDPTTCERDYTDDEVEFMNALDDYKRKNGRMFPTCSEVLEVVRSLGYVRLSPSELAANADAAAARCRGERVRRCRKSLPNEIGDSPHNLGRTNIIRPPLVVTTATRKEGGL